ncbi:hypothetical protein GCM10008960_21910 [Deinococcus sedimenti]|uniref:Sulfocyanin-like C-terminal domain-containing protein n=2 Tax=Deinococcus sedimenti TaxID=1867090 RepID=A0ABQ2S711_9DEIO|nr:hypothetical protein GCM10008960_21910 [Deinococcus sedimenti]
MWRRTLLLGALLGTPAAAHPAGSDLLRDLLRQDLPSRTVTVQVVAGRDGSNAGLNFTGSSGGQGTLLVPLGWTVDLQFRNAGTAPHSVIVLPFTSPLPAQPRAADAAFPGAVSRNVTRGVGRDAAAQTVRFQASRAGEYLIACGVPGHALSGQYLKLSVRAGLKEADWDPAPHAHP